MSLCCYAASLWDSDLWKDIMAETALLSKCTAKHAGRVALQLLAGWALAPPNGREINTNESHFSQVWCGELLTSPTGLDKR